MSLVEDGSGYFKTGLTVNTNIKISWMCLGNDAEPIQDAPL